MSLLLATVGLVVWLSYRAASDTVTLTVNQRLGDIGQQVNHALDDYLGSAWQLTELNRLALTSGDLDPGDLPGLRRRFLRQLEIFRTLTLLSFTDPTGMHLSVGVDRGGLVAPAGTVLARQAPGPAPAEAVDSILDADGAPIRVLRREADYDPRQRPWYRQTLARERTGWLPIHRYPGYPAAALAVSTPVYRDKRLLGVLTAEIMLLDFNALLVSLLISPDTQVLVVDSDQRLIATSSGETPFLSGDGDYPPRLRLRDSAHPLTRLAASGLDGGDAPARVRDPLSGERYFLQRFPYPNRMELDWWSVVLVPREYFMGDIDDSLRHTLWLLLLATLLGLLLGGYGARRLSRPLTRLNQALARAGTDAPEIPAAASRIRELRDLARGFANMQQRLGESFHALRDSEQRFSTLLESVPVGVSVLDTEGRPSLINRAGREILRPGLDTLPLAEFTRRTLILHADGDRPYTLAELPAWRALQGETVRGEIMVLQQGEQRLPLEVFTVPVRDASGQVICAINAFRDISARREAERLQQCYREELEQAVAERTRALRDTMAEREAQRVALEASQARLRESEQRFRTIVEKLPVPVTVWEEQDQFWDSALMFYNRHWEIRFGYTSQQIPLARDWLRLAYPDPDYRQRMTQRIRQRVDSGEDSQQGDEEPVAVRCADGTTRWGHFALARVGRTVIVTFHDITEQHLTSLALREARDTAQRTNRAKDLFLATMSHELRTPLNGILGFAQILAGQADLSDEQRRGIQVIRHSGEHLQALIEDLLDIARIEAGQPDLEIRDFDLGTMAGEVATLARVKAQARGLALHVTAAELPPLRGDTRRLRQVLSNLLDNAIKYSTAGSVTLGVAVLDDAPDPERLRVLFTVDDTGTGIPAARLARALNLFEQVHDDPLPREGVGLGLALCQRLVALMGGELCLQSRVAGGDWASFPDSIPAPDQRSQGTRASFVLDLARAASQRHADTSRRVRVDDHPGNRGRSGSITAAPGAADPPPPPAPLRRRFLERVAEGDVEALLVQAERELADYPLFLARLRELARDFRLNELERWLRSMDDPGNAP